MLRQEGGDYAISNEVTPLRNVAKETKSMPVRLDHHRRQRWSTAIFLPYLLPLVGKLPAIGQLGLTSHRHLRVIADVVAAPLTPPSLCLLPGCGARVARGLRPC